MITLTLTAYNMGSAATEADFDSFAALVARRIEELCAPAGLKGPAIEVDQFPFRGGPDRDKVRGATDDQEEDIREALRVLWEDWCTGGAEENATP